MAGTGRRHGACIRGGERGSPGCGRARPQPPLRSDRSKRRPPLGRGPCTWLHTAACPSQQQRQAGVGVPVVAMGTLAARQGRSGRLAGRCSRRFWRTSRCRRTGSRSPSAPGAQPGGQPGAEPGACGRAQCGIAAHGARAADEGSEAPAPPPSACPAPAQPLAVDSKAGIQAAPGAPYLPIFVSNGAMLLRPSPGSAAGDGGAALGPGPEGVEPCRLNVADPEATLRGTNTLLAAQAKAAQRAGGPQALPAVPETAALAAHPAPCVALQGP